MVQINEQCECGVAPGVATCVIKISRINSTQEDHYLCFLDWCKIWGFHSN